MIERAAAALESHGVRDLSDDGLHAKVHRYLQMPTTTNRRRTKNPRPAAGTMRGRYAFVRALVSHAMKYMGLRHDPLAGFIMPAAASVAAIEKAGEPETYTLNEVRAVLALNEPEDPVWLSFAIAVYAGLRAHEIRALRWQDIDWQNRILRVGRGKGGKGRVMPLQPELYDLLAPLGGPDSNQPRLGLVVQGLVVPRLVVHVHLRPLLERAGVAWDRGTNEITGLPRRLGWHSARRAHAAAFLASGGDGLELQRNLGHTESDLTSHYSAAFTTWKHQVQQEGWPRGQLCFSGASQVRQGAS